MIEESVRSVIERLLETAKTVSADYVAGVLSVQLGNKGKSAESLKQKWIVSSEFVLTDLYVHLPDLGVTQGKTGESRTAGPIIVDSNINQVARHLGQYGAAPDFLVLDGQNRVVAAQRKGATTKIQAYVGNKILQSIQSKNKEYEKSVNALKVAVDRYLNTPTTPGAQLRELKLYVQQGFLSQEELDRIRAQWKSKHTK
jgi:hypothetical protein